MMEDYQKETVDEIRELSSEFVGFSDEEIAKQYHQWSEATYFAGWLSGGEQEFVAFATNRPIDLWRMTKR